MTRAAILSLAASLAILGSALLLAGPLDPPSGAVASTLKTLAEVEPRIAINSTNTPGDADSLFKITQPGSYYLTGNITGVAGKHGIEIAVGGVTLDLAGFDLVGVPSMGAFDAVNVSSDSLRDIAVLNGSVRNWGDEGVDLGFLSIGCRVEGVRASGNAGIGINGGISCTITNCTASFNAQVGIRTNNGSTITNCAATTNSVAGMQVNQGCTIANSSAYINTGPGVLTGSGCTVLDSSFYQNTTHGLQVGEGSTVARCSAFSNGSRGISASNACTITDCTANFNGANGISGMEDLTVSGCTTRSNVGVGIAGEGIGGHIRACTSTANGSHGISLSRGTIEDCAARSNGGHGISVVIHSAVLGSTCSSNTNDGIHAENYCNVEGNTCRENGLGPQAGSGVLCEGTKNRIVGNTCTNNDRGVEVGGVNNVIIGNICADNTTNWVILGNNILGPILDRRNTGAAAVNGHSAPTSLNTTDPHANFTH